MSVSHYQQEAELKDMCAAFPEHAVSHNHVLQDVLARLEGTSRRPAKVCFAWSFTFREPCVILRPMKGDERDE